MSLRILSSPHVSEITSELSLHDILAATSHVFSTFSTRPEDVAAPHRTSIRMSKYDALFMPARLPPLQSGVQAASASSDKGFDQHAIEGTTIKIVSSAIEAGSQAGLPATIVVMDEFTGKAKAIVNARELTALRTAAGSVLATNLVHPPASISTSALHNLVCFGAGLQIKYHIDLLLRSYPDQIKRCTIVGRKLNERTLELKEEIRRKHPNVEIIAGGSDDNTPGFNFEQTVREANIICSATPSKQALYPSAWVSPGTHIILVGSYTKEMREVDNELILRAKGRIIVDSRDACLIEAGELIGAKLTGGDLIELGELVEKSKKEGGSSKGVFEASKDGVSVFKSVGLGVQDVMIASLVLEGAERRGIGTVIDGYD